VVGHKTHPLIATGMSEAEHSRVESWSLEPVFLSPTSVYRISHDGKTRRRQMNAQLMGPPRFRIERKKRYPGGRKATDHFPSRGRRSSRSAAHAHALAIARMATHRPIDATAATSRDTSHQSVVDPLDAVIAKLFGQCVMNFVSFRHDQDPRGAAVEPMDDSGPQDSADSGQIAAMVEERVNQRATGVARRWVNDLTRRLVDHD